jgi:hypothetical protein
VGGGGLSHKNNTRTDTKFQSSIGYILIFLLVVGSIPRFNFFSIAMSHFDWPMKKKKKVLRLWTLILGISLRTHLEHLAKHIGMAIGMAHHKRKF